MSSVIQIKGLTKFTINMDPSVWIFDQRKIDLHIFLQSGEHEAVDERETSGSYGIPLQPFLTNSEPLPEAERLICHLSSGQTTFISKEEARNSILAFAKKGKPLSIEEGPLQLYFGDNPSREPISQIIGFELSE
jgi:hypothetical protein